MEIKSIAEDPSVEMAQYPPTVEERRALIERVVASDLFSRSARLRDFLLYVGKNSLKEGSPDIHEQEIGTKVFGRSDSYDCSADGIVRVNATELRKRIESYFESAGVSEPLVFEIPRGGYKPVFRWKLPEAAKHEALNIEQSLAISLPSGTEPLVRNRPRFFANAVWTVVSLALTIACAVLVQQNRVMRMALSPWDGRPAVAAFWTGFLRSNQRIDVVLPDDSASVVEDIAGRPNTLGGYISRNYDWIASSTMSADRKEDFVPDTQSQSGHLRSGASGAADSQ